MSFLGSSLQENLNKCNGHFTIKTVLMIGFQAIERLETLHSHGFIHRDIKPENFVTGCDSNDTAKKTLHLIDFGLSCSYLDSNNKHIPFNDDAKISGTLYYLSVYGHLGIQATRRDDLISLGFMLVHLFKGYLPWIGVQGSMKEIVKSLYLMKSSISLDNLCSNLPEEFIKYFDYVLGLKYFEKPDYSFLKELFIKMMENKGFQNDGEFDWISNEGIDLFVRKISSRSPALYLKKAFDSSVEIFIL